MGSIVWGTLAARTGQTLGWPRRPITVTLATGCRAQGRRESLTARVTFAEQRIVEVWALKSLGVAIYLLSPKGLVISSKSDGVSKPGFVHKRHMISFSAGPTRVIHLE